MGQSYVAGIQYGRMISAHFRKCIAFVAEQPMHVSDEPQVLFVSACLAYCTPPFFYSLQYLHLHPRRSYRRPFGEPSDQLIKKLFGTDLQVKGIATVLDTDVEQIQGKHCDVGVAVVDIAHDSHGSLARSRALLGVDEVGNLKIKGQIWFVVLGTASGLYESLEL